MRFFAVLIFCFPLLLVAQQNDDHLKISKSKLQTAVSVKEIVSDIPAACFVNSFELTANMKGSIATAKNNSDDFNPGTKELIKLLEKGNRFYISKIDSKCPDKLKKEYSFVITE